ncbi:MAG TPA: DedA family protein [candidate division Zixibacteria bacterium]|nr:DedA family protein [candidate division Zixibacteria bacterium]
MEVISSIIDFFLHIDQYLEQIIRDYGLWTYGLLFLIIFMETGLVVTPFLPGDSLLFAAGTFAAGNEPALNVWVLWALVFVAAVLGDSVNYWIGNKVGPKAFEKDYRFLRKEYLDRTQRFYDKHGGKTIILARFVPIVRTFAPFIAGVGTMSYGRFFSFNIIGAFLWTAIFVFLGYFFGQIPFVKENFELVVVAIILVSVVPMVVEFVRSRSHKETPTSAVQGEENPG